MLLGGCRAGTTRLLLVAILVVSSFVATSTPHRPR